MLGGKTEVRETKRCLENLSSGLLRVWFPFDLTALSSVFDDRDGVLNVAHHVDATTDLLIRGLVRDPVPPHLPEGLVEGQVLHC